MMMTGEKLSKTCPCITLPNTNPWDETWASGMTGCDCMSCSTAGDFQVLQAVMAHLMDEASMFRCRELREGT